MKLFFIKFPLFLLPLAVLFFAVEYRLKNRNSYYEQKYNGLVAQVDSIQLIVLGNSHAAASVIATELSIPSYNLAFGYQPLKHDILLTRKFLPQLKQLKYVVISIDYQTFYYNTAGERDFFYSYYYGIKEFDDYKKKLSFFFFVYSPKTAINLLITDNKIAKKGWVGGEGFNYDTSLINDTKGKARALEFTTMANTNNHLKVEIFNGLDSFIFELKKRGITPIIITNPCTRHHNKYLDPKILYDNQVMIDTLIRKYSLTYLNHLDDSSFNDTHFVDVDHLNTDGARLFTQKLDSAIRVIQATN